MRGCPHGKGAQTDATKDSSRVHRGALVAEDRSAAGVRDQTGPGPDADETHDDIRGRASTGWDGALASASVKAW
jgi:hypothetical protein